MTNKDLYLTLLEVEEKKDFFYIPKNASNSDIREIIKPQKAKADILNELLDRGLIKGLHIVSTLAGKHSIDGHPYLTPEGHKFINNYRGPFKSKLFSFGKFLLLAIATLVSVTSVILNIIYILGFLKIIPSIK